ncbi:MAG: NAD(P)/FAD-dependent oxidoreductase [Proteobacteria bacterium]|jgi:spermidine dehydrogenase|nr:NAD(P)/FAD-dependent oxidoreductase [Pseudomonadota bacterium]
MKRSDRQLGMHRDITRRDFLNGINVAVTGSLLSTPLAQALAATDGDPSAQMLAGYYPPTRDGLRGSHPGSFEVAHRMRDGERFDDPRDSIETGEDYDLIVVGGGISGLAAAWFFRKEAGPDARILIVENHDDFGGHAKRNEFHIDGRMLVDLGGTEYIEAPWSYPAAAKSLLDDLGIDVSQARKVFDHELYPSLGLRGGIFFDKKTFGANRLVAGNPDLQQGEQQTAYVTLPAELEYGIGDRDAVTAFLRQTPLSAATQEKIIELFCGDREYLANYSTEEKLNFLQSISYIEFLTDIAGASQEVADFFWMWRGSYMGNGVDLTPAVAAMRYGLPGEAGLKLDLMARRSPEWQKHSYKEDFHFPDGNASVARMLVRAMIPRVAPGNSMHDIISAKFDYSQLDQDDSPVRLRLNSTVVHARHVGDPDNAKQVEVTYVQDGQSRRVRAGFCVMACYNSVIPHLCPEIPADQRKALQQSLREPLVSTNVLFRNWTAFQKIGIFAAYCPGSFFSDIRLTYPLQFGDYQSARTPAEPITVKMYRIPVSGKGHAADQFREGRHELLGTTFETFERNIREQLGTMLAEGGFDPARDIRAITVNRWPHGYALGYNHEKNEMSYYRSEDWTDADRHWLKGRQRFGRIAIANSDADARAMTEAAIEQGYRATRELLGES